MLFQQTVGGTYSSAAGGGSTITPNAVNERIFRVARNSYTKTATITAASFVRGNPACLASQSASTNGYDIIQPDTMGANYLNNMLIGVVADYPDTTVGRTGVWQPEDVGLVQCYGLNTNVVLSVASTTIALGLVMVPDTGSQFQTVIGPVTAAATSTAAHQEVAGLGGLVILAQTVASQVAGTKAVAAFIRCM